MFVVIIWFVNSFTDCANKYPHLLLNWICCPAVGVNVNCFYGNRASSLWRCLTSETWGSLLINGLEREKWLSPLKLSEPAPLNAHLVSSDSSLSFPSSWWAESQIKVAQSLSLVWEKLLELVIVAVYRNLNVYIEAWTDEIEQKTYSNNTTCVSFWLKRIGRDLEC